MRSLRQFLGAVGLLIVAIGGSLLVLSLGTDQRSAPTLAMWTALGLVLWGQAVASQAGLAYRVSIEWLLVLIGIVLGLGVLALLFAAGLSVVFGSTSGTIVVAIGTAVVAAWARRDPGRAAVLKALGRAAVARTTSDDARLLALGPRALLRPESIPGARP